MKILIAEDDPVSRRLLKSMLVKWDYEVIVTSNGKEALDVLISEDSPQLVILDWMMPEIDGIEVCRRVRKLNKESYTYLLLLTAKWQKEDIIEGLLSGADDYVTKPFDALELKLRLKAAKRIVEQEVKLSHQAQYDQLTNLPNRALFIKRLERLITRPQRHQNYQFAVFFLDLDRFKVINDYLGHAIGDQLLIEVARRLETCIRVTDTVARFGGDEFAVLLDDINDISDTKITAGRIQKKLSVPYNLSGHEVITTASIGIALSATGYDWIDDFLRDADSAMYHAKAIGRGHYEIFDSRRHASVENTLQIENDLWQAVEQMEFQVHYQPIVSMTSGVITGVEALLRWKHPQRGFIPPNEFIPIAEETGLIMAMSEWVLRTACAQNRTWLDSGYQNLKIHVTFSARQFYYQDLPELVGKVLQENGLAAQYLNLEITESIAMETKSVKILNDLTAMGIETSIDDFGTGHSSLGALKNFPIKALKIDKSFIDDITVNSDVEEIVKAIITMAHSLKMKVIAEGVETEEQLAFLRSQHCDEIQGYYFSPPIPGEEFTKILETSLSLSSIANDRN
jgi:diguanylate cyclase (GGDEF)-like protein